MGQYAVLITVTQEFRDDSGIDIAGFIAAVCRDQVEAEGCHPVGEPSIDWYEIAQDEVDMELAAQRLAGIEEPAAPFRAGDWRVRAVIDVAEDEPLPSRAGQENIARLR